MTESLCMVMMIAQGRFLHKVLHIWAAQREVVLSIDWQCAICRSRVTDSAKIVIGTCMLTSARSTDFWLRLCNARHLDGAEALMAAFGKAEEAGKSALQQHCYQHTKQQIRQVACSSTHFQTW